jgi:Leucine-rich repeat (LRR) protein
VPAEIGNLINLKILELHDNKLKSVPAEIGNLINLQQLFLRNNKFESLPAEILKIKEKISIYNTRYDIKYWNILSI